MQSPLIDVEELASLLAAEQWEYLTSVDEPDPQVLDEIGTRHGAPTLGPPIRATNLPPGVD